MSVFTFIVDSSRWGLSGLPCRARHRLEKQRGRSPVPEPAREAGRGQHAHLLLPIPPILQKLSRSMGTLARIEQIYGPSRP